MRVEAIATRPGEVRLEDLVAELGAELRQLDHVDLVVLADGDEPPAVQCVALTEVRQGRGRHAAFACPTCATPCFLLVTDGQGGLRCRPCAQRRTAHQRHKNGRDWKERDRLEDKIVRVALARGRPTPGRAQRLRLLAQDLLARDRARILRVIDEAMRKPSGGRR